MLKYGEIVPQINSVSKTLIPRNITYRQNDTFKTTVSSEDILSTIQSSSFTIPNAQTITASSGNFTVINTSVLNVDTIKKKTNTASGVTINDNLYITDQNATTSSTFIYQFTKNGSMNASSFNFNIPIIEIMDNVIKINSKFNINSNQKNYDSVISGFYFPNIKDTPDTNFKFNNILVIPANYYVKNTNLALSFAKYTNPNIYFPNNNDDTVNVDSVRLIKTNYEFNKDTTDSSGVQLNVDTDSSIADLNRTNNLLNLEINNLALSGGNFLLLQKSSFNPSDADINNNTFKFYASNFVINKLLFEITSTVVNVYNPIMIDNNININKNGIRFGPTQNLFTITDSNNNKFIGCDITNNTVYIYKPLDLSSNGIINFGDSIQFNNNSNNIVLIKTSGIVINKGSLQFTPDSSNNIIFDKHITFNNGTINVLTVDNFGNLIFNTANSKIVFTTGINFNNGTINVLTVDNTGNLIFNTANSDIVFNTGINFNNGISNVLTVDNTGNLIFNTANSKIVFTTGINFNDGTNDIVSINSSSVDLSSNLKFNNNSAQINYQSKLILSKTLNDNLPVLSYNINSNSTNYYEKKYLLNTSIDSSGTIILLCKDILNSQNEQITFTGKIISRDLSNHSMHYTITGYSQYDASNNNKITYTLTTLSSLITNWTINTITISGLDLKIILQSNQPTKTNWLISIESISI